MSCNAIAIKGDNPFAKSESVNIGKDVAWDINKSTHSASKTVESNGAYYHLRFDNKRLELRVTVDEAGSVPKKFSQLEIKSVNIDGKQNALFQWCLNNQQRHNRFLQQGLTVKKDICKIDGEKGSFVMRLNKGSLASLQSGSRLQIITKPFRTQLNLNYDISDFQDMYIALNAKPAAVAATSAAGTAKGKPAAKKCWAGPPAKYKTIKSVEYECSDATAKKDAEAWVIKLVNKEKVKEQKKASAQAAERERARKLAEEKKQKEIAAKLAQEEKLRVEAAALAASQAKQAQISSEITQKMVKVCEKYWSKGEHRCYCQKYIEYAPSEIKASSTCE